MRKNFEELRACLNSLPLSLKITLQQHSNLKCVYFYVITNLLSINVTAVMALRVTSCALTMPYQCLSSSSPQSKPFSRRTKSIPCVILPLQLLGERRTRDAHCFLTSPTETFLSQNTLVQDHTAGHCLEVTGAVVGEVSAPASSKTSKSSS